MQPAPPAPGRTPAVLLTCPIESQLDPTALVPQTPLQTWYVGGARRSGDGFTAQLSGIKVPHVFGRSARLRAFSSGYRGTILPNRKSIPKRREVGRSARPSLTLYEHVGARAPDDFNGARPLPRWDEEPPPGSRRKKPGAARRHLSPYIRSPDGDCPVFPAIMRSSGSGFGASLDYPPGSFPIRLPGDEGWASRIARATNTTIMFFPPESGLSQVP